MFKDSSLNIRCSVVSYIGHLLAMVGDLTSAELHIVQSQTNGKMLSITHLFPHNELVHLPYIAVATNTKAD